MHAKAQFAIRQIHCFCLRAAQPWSIQRPPPVGIEVRIEISVIAEIHSFFESFIVIYESSILRGLWIQKEQAQTGGLLAAGRKIENQALYSERGLAPAQIVEPDQPERENAIGVAGIRRGADGSPCRRT